MFGDIEVLGGFLIVARRRSLGKGPAVVLEFEKGGLLCSGVGLLLLAAKLQDVASEVALAVNLDDGALMTGLCPRRGADISISAGR